MSTYDNGCIDTPDWQPEPRCCPFTACDVCGDNSQPITGYGAYPTVPPNIELGSE